MKRFEFGVRVLVVVALAFAGCGKKDSDSADGSDTSTGVSSAGGATSDGSIAADVPSDSTGASAPITLDFGTADKASAALALQGAATLDLGGGVILTDARISVGSIKIKANKEMGEAERALKEQMKEEKKSREKALEADKEALEQRKEEIKQSYESQFEAATTDAEKDALKAEMQGEVALVEEDLAALEGAKEAEMAALEAQKDGNLKWRGPYVYDLIAGTVVPEIPEVQLVDGSYRRIEFKIKPNRSLEGTDPLLNHSIFLAGTVTVNGTATPFSASFRVDEEFKLMGSSAFKVDPTLANALTVAFDPTIWFSSISFAGATVDSLGTIVISDISNQSIWESVLKNLKKSTKFGKDNDGDGKLKAEESAGDGEEAAAEAISVTE